MAQPPPIGDLQLTTPAFEHLGEIPRRHSSEGESVSPQLRWDGAPEGTRQWAIVCHDPEAPMPDGFTHWVLYGIPAEVTQLDEGADRDYVAGVNGTGQPGYLGPLPPEGHGLHHYFFWVYALDSELDLEPGLSRRDLLDRIGDHVIEQNRVIGTYSRG